MRRLFAALSLGFLGVSLGRGADLAAASARMDQDVAAGKPLVAHVIVALVDNEHQGIVPVPASLGDGAAPRSNLYWGAMYGVRSWFRRQPAWRTLSLAPSADARVLDRALFHRSVERGGRSADVYLVAEAWKGERIGDAIRRFLELSRGGAPEPLRADSGSFDAGGAAHVLVFIGHNGLMDFAPPLLDAPRAAPLPHAAIVLACLSDEYFAPLLAAHSALLLTTTGLMAPEAYSLDAALERWFAGASPAQVRAAAGSAYARYQKIPQVSGLRLFRTQSTNGKP